MTKSVSTNFEPEQLLLSFGERVKVIEPEELQKRIQLRLKDALAHY